MRTTLNIDPDLLKKAAHSAARAVRTRIEATRSGTMLTVCPGILPPSVRPRTYPLPLEITAEAPVWRSYERGPRFAESGAIRVVRRTVAAIWNSIAVAIFEPPAAALHVPASFALHP